METRDPKTPEVGTGGAIMNDITQVCIELRMRTSHMEIQRRHK